jgi:hypothetical protein
MCEPRLNKSDESGLIDVQEFKTRMKVSRSTVFYWKASGVLIPGRHFIKQGRVLRFFWDLNLVREIHDSQNKLERKANSDNSPEIRTKTNSNPIKKEDNPCVLRSGRTVVNLDY